jgi:exodeoxyribonuclease V alpha subunit
VAAWVQKYCQSKEVNLSSEQASAVEGIVHHQFSILTGGPGCGKTTTTLVIVRLLEAIGKRVLLAAPTGRAAQRMR